MKLPNGYGSVYKLSGKRRKPWVARKTETYTFDEEKKRAYPVYKFIGYYATKAEALQALSDYNRDPYDLHLDTITLGELYDKWSAEHFATISESTTRLYKTAYAVLEPIKHIRVQEIKLDHLQATFDSSGRNSPVLTHTKTLLGQMYDYAVAHEILSNNKRAMLKYLDAKKPGNPNARKKSIFSPDEIQLLWRNADTDELITTLLILIYTGLRCMELLELKKEDVHLDGRWLFVRKSKTKSGIREVPIAEKIVPLLEHWLGRNSIYLISKPNGSSVTYNSYARQIRKVLTPLNHTIHETRHTCVSLLTDAMVDERIIQQIVGHAGANVTQSVYTHSSLEAKLQAINKI